MNRIIACLLILCVYEISANSINIRLAGGEDSEDGQAPFVAAVLYKSSHICAGVIVNTTKVLTTANCAISTCANTTIVECIKHITVKVGSSKLSQGGTVYNVKTFKIHDDYDIRKFGNNIAVITLASEIQFSDNAKLINLPDRDIVEGTIATAYGWGATTPTRNAMKSDALLSVELKLTNSAKCKELFKDMGVNDVCTIGVKKDSGLCRGDTGDPLIQDGKVIGVSTYGVGLYCSIDGSDYFVNVYKYVDFIKSQFDETLPNQYKDNPQLVWTD